MEHIDDVECIHNGRLDVRLDGRVLFKVCDIIKIKARRSHDGGIAELSSVERESVVSTSGELVYFDL